MAKQSGGTLKTFGIEQKGVGGWTPVCEETMLLPLLPNPQISASLILPAPGVEGACLCVCVGVILCSLFHRTGCPRSPPPLCLFSVRLGQERSEGNGDPFTLLSKSFPPTLSLPCSSLENAKIHDVNKKSTMAKLCPVWYLGDTYLLGASRRASV